MSQDLLIRARDLKKTYLREEAPPVEALRGVDVEVEVGEFVAIAGPSGCGKSTLLSVLSGLDLPTSGELILLGRDLLDTDEEQLAELRNREIGFVFQAFHLVPSMTALENVAFPAELSGDREAVARARELLERVGLPGRHQSFPHQLSGGEKQRVALCRAVINRPRLIFADEPTGNLDSKNGEQILELLLQWRSDYGCALVLVSHSQALVERADRTIHLRDGAVVDP